MLLDPIDLLKQRLKEIDSIECLDDNFKRHQLKYKSTILFLECNGYKEHEKGNFKLSNVDINWLKDNYEIGQADYYANLFKVHRETILKHVKTKIKMSKRYTDTEKYKDSWFLDLNPTEKLLFYYLIDNVDNAGFYEISFRHIQFHLGLTRDEILGAFKGLNRGLVGSEYDLNNGDIIFLKNFMKHQLKLKGKINLNPYNNYHLHIIDLMTNRFNFINKHAFFDRIVITGVKKNKEGDVIETTHKKLKDYLDPNKGLRERDRDRERERGKERERESYFEKPEKLFSKNVKSEEFVKLDDIKSKFQYETTWKESICRIYKQVENDFNIDTVDSWLEVFFKTISGDGEEYKTISETKKHFNRWLKIEIKKQHESQSNNNTGASDSFKEKTARRLGVI